MAFAGQSFVVVGGAGGIGFETSKYLLSAGLERLAIFDLKDSTGALERLREQFPSKIIIFVTVDIRHRQDFAKAFQSVVDQFESIDGIINGAGVVKESSADATIGINTLGVIYATEIALEHMSVSKGGRGGLIVNIASVLGLDYLYSIPLYTASKHAVVGYTRAMADEKFETMFGVKFVTICPGFTDTPLVSEIAVDLYSPDFEEDLNAFAEKRGVQTAEECGRNLVEVLEKSVNGSVWIINNGANRPVTLHTYWNFD